MRTSRSLTVCCSLLLGGVPGLVGCLIPGGLLWGGCGPGLGGWCAWSRGGLLWGVVCLVQGGCLLLGGVCSRGWVSQHALRQTPLPLWTDTRLWKYYLGPTSLRPVIKFSWVCTNNTLLEHTVISNFCFSQSRHVFNFSFYNCCIRFQTFVLCRWQIRVPTRPGKTWKKWEYTWKTWKCHGILKKFNKYHGKTWWLLKIHPWLPWNNRKFTKLLK